MEMEINNKSLPQQQYGKCVCVCACVDCSFEPGRLVWIHLYCIRTCLSDLLFRGEVGRTTSESNEEEPQQQQQQQNRREISRRTSLLLSRHRFCFACTLPVTCCDWIPKPDSPHWSCSIDTQWQRLWTKKKKKRTGRGLEPFVCFWRARPKTNLDGCGISSTWPKWSCR